MLFLPEKQEWIYFGCRHFEELEILGASEIHVGTAKLSGRAYEFREPTLRREQPVRSENLSGERQGEPEGFQPTETKDDAEARKDFWLIQGDFIYRHHFELRVQLYVENSTEMR